MTKARSLPLFIASLSWAAQRVAQLLSSLITLPVALHTLGLAGFGVWGAATSLAWLASLLTVGFGSALVALIPRSLADGATERSRAYVTAALFGGMALAAALLLGGSAAILLSGRPVPQPPFLIAGLALILNIPLSISFELWLALQKGHMGALWATLQTLLSLTFILLGARAGAGITLMTAAIYTPLLIANAGSLAHVLYIHHPLRPHHRPRLQPLRDVLGQGGLFFIITAAITCATSFDNVMALAWLGATASAQMAVAMRVCTTASGLIGSMTQPFWPSFADALAAHDTPWALRMLKTGMATVLALALGGSACLITFGQPVLSWWLHQNLHLSHGLLLVMAGWIIGTSFICVPSALLNAASRLRPQIIILTTAALAGFALKYFAAQSFGVTGILAVTPVLWLTVVGPLFLWFAWRVVR